MEQDQDKITDLQSQLADEQAKNQAASEAVALTEAKLEKSLVANDQLWVQNDAGGLSRMRTSTRPTLHILPLLRAFV